MNDNNQASPVCLSTSILIAWRAETKEAVPGEADMSVASVIKVLDHKNRHRNIDKEWNRDDSSPGMQ